MKSRTAKYGFINAKLRAGIEKLFTKQFFLSLLNADSIDQLIEMLRNTPYREASEIYSSTGSLDDFERRVYSEGVYTIKGILRHVSDDVAHIVRALLIKYEIENIKYALRRLSYLERSAGSLFEKGFIENGIYLNEEMVHRINWQELIQSGSIDEMIRTLKNTPYQEILNVQLAETTEMKSTFDLEVALDRYYYSNLITAIRELESFDREIASRIIGIRIDIENIRTLIRIKRYYRDVVSAPGKVFIRGGSRITDKIFVSGLESEVFPGPMAESKKASVYFLDTEKHVDMSRTPPSTLELLEVTLKKIFIREARKPLSGYPFTIGVILAFIFLKIDEIENLMAVTYAKAYSMDEVKVKAIFS